MFYSSASFNDAVKQFEHFEYFHLEYKDLISYCFLQNFNNMLF
jgi:hypothetical protein